MIRKLKDSDKDGFLHLLSQLSDVSIEKYTSKHWEEVYTRISTNPFCKCIVAEINGEIVGTARGQIHETFLHGGGFWGSIEDVVVLTEYRGRGIGLGLINELDLFFQIHHCYKISVVCDMDIVPFYKQAKFIPQGEDRVLWKHFKK